MRLSFISVAFALAATATSAFAADLRAPRLLPPPAVLPVTDAPLWSGFYGGPSIGGTWSANDTVGVSGFPGACAPTFPNCTPNPNFPFLSASLAHFDAASSHGGFIGGGQIGYNWQFANGFVVGFETDIQGIAAPNGPALLASGAVDPAFPVQLLFQAAAAQKSTDYLGTARGRIGYLLTPTFLVFASGGFAYGGVTANAHIAQLVQAEADTLLITGGGAYSDTRPGWAAGGGGEWMFAPGWSARVDYLYYDLGALSRGLPPLREIGGLACVFPEASTSFNGYVVRAGLNYHFSLETATIAATY